SLPAGGDKGDRAAYEHALAFKGAVFMRQHRRRQFQRVARESKDAEVVRLTAALESASRQLAVAAFAPVSDAAGRRKRLAERTKEKDGREAELSRRSAAFRQLQASQRLSPEALQKLLPEGVALVAYLEYPHHPAAKAKDKPHRRLTAFVVRK